MHSHLYLHSPIKLSVSQYNTPHRFGKTGRSFEATRLTFTHAHTPQAKASANFIDLCSLYFVVKNFLSIKLSEFVQPASNSIKPFSNHSHTNKNNHKKTINQSSH